MYKWSLNSASGSDRFSQGYSAPTNTCIQKIPRSLSQEKVLQNLPQRSRSPTYNQDHKRSRSLPIIDKGHSFSPNGKTTNSVLDKNHSFSPLYGDTTLCVDCWLLAP